MAFDVLAGKTLLGRYRVVMPIGRGGMGTVYLARTEGAAGFAKPVVVKSVHAELLGDPTMVQMFAREARLLSNLHHPGIVNVLDFDEEEGTYVMVLEYVHGYDLGAWARYREQTGSPFALEDALHIAISVLDTLSYTHAYQRADGTKLSIIHRDISPGNVLVSLDGQVKVADFGIARAADEAGEYRSRVGTFKGKLAFSAPELVQGSEATPSADVYSLAVVIVQILLGENPFRGQTMGETVQRVLTEVPPSITAKRPDVPPELDGILARALAKDPTARYPNAAALAHELRRLRGVDDENALRTFAEHVREDFDGGLPLLLGLDPLVDRDAAWRHEQAGTPVGLSSTPPALSRRTRDVFDAPTAVLDTSRFDAVTVRLPHHQAETSATVASPSPPRRSRWLGIAAAVVILLGLGVAAGAFFTHRPEPEPLVSGLFIASGDVPLLRAPAATTAAASAASSGATDDNASALLSAALAERQPAIESCFEAHVEQLSGAPEIGLRFQVAADGTVAGADLTPPALSKTPLGECLLHVAKTTRFPRLGREVSFRLPITARVSR